MKSIAENDLGEPLLVYKNKSKNIVADGNRRVSVLKVLNDDHYAPSPAIAKYAQELRQNNKIQFKKIQAQTSTDKSLVSRTVYERHSGGKSGVSRIPWDAYAAARFGFDEKIGDNKEWRIMALLSKTEDENPQFENFLASGFSYEIFRRILRAAIKQRIVSENIFSERGEKIKKTARKDLIKDAISKTCKFLKSMQNKELTLSRKNPKHYADGENVNNYLKQFNLSPDNQELEDAKADTGEDGPKDDGTNGGTDSTPTATNGDASLQDDDSNTTADNNADSDSGEKSRGYGITESAEVLKKLKSLKSRKLIGLYNSLCIVSLKEHPALMYVGAWSFLEVLSRCMGNKQTDFTGFFNNKMQSLGIDKQTSKDCGNTLSDISKKGNATKHSRNATQLTAIQLKADFEVLEPLINSALDCCISQKT